MIEAIEKHSDRTTVKSRRYLWKNNGCQVLNGIFQFKLEYTVLYIMHKILYFF